MFSPSSLQHVNVICIQSSVEADLLLLMERIKNSLNTVMESSSCYLDREALTTTMELIQVNIIQCYAVGVVLTVLSHYREILTAPIE